MENLGIKEGEGEKKKVVLLVEDDENTRQMYAEVFRQKNFEVIEAVDGVEGLDKATKEKPDVIFTGIVMPRMDGFMMFEALKKNVSTSQIPVAISSHMGREEDQKKALEMGAKDFIPRDLNTPIQVTERIMAIVSANTYKVKIIPNELDAKKLLADLKISESLNCDKCGGELVLSISRGQEMKAKFVCLKCNVTV